MLGDLLGRIYGSVERVILSRRTEGKRVEAAADVVLSRLAALEEAAGAGASETVENEKWLLGGELDELRRAIAAAPVRFADYSAVEDAIRRSILIGGRVDEARPRIDELEATRRS